MAGVSVEVELSDDEGEVVIATGDAVTSWRDPPRASEGGGSWS